MSQQSASPKCPKCGCGVFVTEKRPDGFNICTGCNYSWPNYNPIPSRFALSPEEQEFLREQARLADNPTKEMIDSMHEQVLVKEIQKMTLAPGDDLIVKLRGDMDGMDSLITLREMLEQKYPNNRVLMFYLPEGADIDFSILKKI